MTIQEQFKKARTERDFKSNVIESVTGSGAGSLSKFEQGASNPTIKTLEKWAKVLDYKIAIVPIEREISANDIVRITKKLKANPDIFLKTFNKIRELEKRFDSAVSEMTIQQLCGFVFYRQIEYGKCEAQHVKQFCTLMCKYYETWKDGMRQIEYRRDVTDQLEFLYTNPK